MVLEGGGFGVAELEVGSMGKGVVERAMGKDVWEVVDMD